MSPTRRVVLIDTVAQLPGLLPWHAVTALQRCDQVLVGNADHPLYEALQVDGVNVAVLDGDDDPGRDLLTGVSIADRQRARTLLDRVDALVRLSGDTAAVGYILGGEDTDDFTRCVGLEAAKRDVEVEVVYFTPIPNGMAFLDLVEVQRRLLSPNGCPWDAEQTHTTLVPYLIEEAHEVAEAVAEGDAEHICEELGDVLMQVTFHAELAETFTVDDVAKGIVEKLTRRHPHVFGDATADSAADVESSWEKIKADEKPEREGPFDGIPATLPSPLLASKTLRRAVRNKLIQPVDVADAAADAADLIATLVELPLAKDTGLDHDTGQTGDADGVIGQLLWHVVAAAETLGVDADQALRAATAEFRETHG